MSRVQTDIRGLTEVFKRLQDAQSLGPLQQAAVDTQKTARQDIERLFQEQAEGFSENVGAGFREQQTRQVGNLADRGLSSTAVGLLGDLGAGRESQLALGQLQDALLGNRVDSLTGISKNLANIFTGSTDLGTGLISQLLGLDQLGSSGRRRTGGGGVNVVGGRGGGFSSGNASTGLGSISQQIDSFLGGQQQIGAAERLLNSRFFGV